MRALSCVAVAVAILLCGTVHAGYTNCSGSVNPFPVNREAPTLVKSAANGKRYLAGKGNDTFHVLHLYGSHYDMGYAHGQLMGDYFGDVWTAFMAYMELQLEEQYPDLPPWLIDLGAAVGIPLALQLVADATYPYTPQKYLDEMHGIADGSGFDYNKVYQVNMFPEMIKAACTIVGATKSATVNGNVAHLRGLDFGVHMPLRDWPLLTIFHGDGSEPKVANFGWILMIGSLTGFSETPIGIGEKVWLDHKQGISSFNGEPWMFLLRDVLYTQNLQQALVTLANANRTCAIHVGIGDGNENEFRGVQMAHDAFEVFNWSSLDYPEHPVIKDVMYWDKHEQPSHFWCLSTLLKGYVGNITAERMATEISGYAATGNVHSVTFDYLEKVAFFANVRKSNVTAGDINAYNRQYTWLNMSALFATPL